MGLERLEARTPAIAMNGNGVADVEGHSDLGRVKAGHHLAQLAEVASQINVSGGRVILNESGDPNLLVERREVFELRLDLRQLLFDGHVFLGLHEAQSVVLSAKLFGGA